MKKNATKAAMPGVLQFVLEKGPLETKVHVMQIPELPSQDAVGRFSDRLYSYIEQVLLSGDRLVLDGRNLTKTLPFYLASEVVGILNAAHQKLADKGSQPLMLANWRESLLDPNTISSGVDDALNRAIAKNEYINSKIAQILRENKIIISPEVSVVTSDVASKESGIWLD